MVMAGLRQACIPPARAHLKSMARLLPDQQHTATCPTLRSSRSLGTWHSSLRHPRILTLPKYNKCSQRTSRDPLSCRVARTRLIMDLCLPLWSRSSTVVIDPCPRQGTTPAPLCLKSHHNVAHCQLTIAMSTRRRIPRPALRPNRIQEQSTRSIVPGLSVRSWVLPSPDLKRLLPRGVRVYSMLTRHLPLWRSNLGVRRQS